MKNYFKKLGLFHWLLNRPYSKFSRFFIGLLFFIICIIIFFDFRLGNLFFIRVLINNDLKSESRRLIWCLKKSYLPISLKTDIMFDFCSGLNLNELNKIKNVLKRLKNSKKDIFYEIDLLKILAYECDFLIENKDNISISKLSKKFTSQYLKVKNYLEKMPAKKILKPHNKLSKKNIGIDSLKAKKVLLDLACLFELNKIKWFVLAGTFLGFIREKSFLRHDLDIDIGLMSEDVSLAQIKEVLRKSPLFEISKIEYQKYFLSANNFLNKPTFARIIHKNGITLDIFWHFLEGNKIYHGTSSILWKNTPFELNEYEVYGLKVKGPKNANLYLKETYGNWRKEKLNYNFHRDMISLTGTINFLGLEYLLRRKLYCGKYNQEELTKIEKLLI